MSKYTTTIKDILESFLIDNNYDKQATEIIELTKDKFFNFKFKWYNNTGEGLDDFKKDFLLTYYNRYIGFETLGLFKVHMQSKLNLIMLTYEKLYSEIIKGDTPTTNYEEHREVNKTNQYKDTGETKNTTKNTSNTESIDSDNPQVTIQTNDYASTMNRGETISNSNSTNNGTSSHDEKENHKENIYGLKGISRAEAIYKYKKQIININKELINYCETLFLGVW